MLQIFRTCTLNRRPAAIAVKIAVLLPVLLGVVALSFDGGMLYDSRRKAQSAADAAALAAAGELFKIQSNSSYSLNQVQDRNGKIAAHAQEVARVNLSPQGHLAQVVVNIPPKSGPYTDEPSHAEVLISYPQRRGFSAIFGRGDLQVIARAVARGRWYPPGFGIIVLDPSGSGTLSIGGGAQGNVPNSHVIVNSSNLSAASGSGTNATLTALRFDMTGGFSSNSEMNFIGEKRQTPPTPDPYRDVPEPDPSTLPSRSTRNMQTYNSLPNPMPNFNFTVNANVNGSTVTTHYLLPGVYNNGIRFTQGNVYLRPGIYYMLGGGFSFSGQGSLTAYEVMLFNDPGRNNGSIDISGQGTVTWTPPSTGPYAGITLFQKRGATQTVKISGQGIMHIEGVLYVPNGLLTISGNGDNFVGNQLVAWQLSLSGNGTFNVPWEASKLRPVRELKLVE